MEKIFLFVISLFFNIIIFSVNAYAEEVVLLDEHFNNVLNGVPIGWNEVQNPSAFSVIDGKYVATVLPLNPGKDDSLSYTINQNWLITSLEVDVTGISGPDRFIRYRYDYLNPTRKGYTFKWYEDFYMNKVEMWGIKDGSCTKIANYNNELGKTNRIKIETVGNLFSFFIDNNLVLQCTDNDPVVDGGVGIYLHASGSIDPNTEDWYTNSVSYDNLIVKGNYKNHLFNLPINYTDRNGPTQEMFRFAFWDRMTAVFDHNKLGNQFQPFTGDIYNKKACPSGKVGITCYDTHNGTDFRAIKDKNNPDFDILPVADGKVVYVSDTSESGKCMSSKNSYGCVVIIDHEYDNLYSLYAHMSQIDVTKGDRVKYTNIIGQMGNTGCGPRCGPHLHLGVLKDKTPDPALNSLTASDWEDVLAKSQPEVSGQSDAPPKHYCTYKTPDGNILSFQDPSGWKGTGEDRWALPTSEEGCGTQSPYLWMREIEKTKPLINLNEYFVDL